MPQYRHALTSKRPKYQELTDTERKDGLNKLKAIKKKHAPKALELIQRAMAAVKELRAIETEMSTEAGAVHANYNTAFPEFKLTFELADSDIAEEYDHDFIGLEACETALESMETDAHAALDQEKK